DAMRPGIAHAVPGRFAPQLLAPRVAGAGVLAGALTTSLAPFHVLRLIARPPLRLLRRVAASALRRIHRPPLGESLVALGLLLVRHGRTVPAPLGRGRLSPAVQGLLVRAANQMPACSGNSFRLRYTNCTNTLRPSHILLV